MRRRIGGSTGSSAAFALLLSCGPLSGCTADSSASDARNSSAPANAAGGTAPNKPADPPKLFDGGQVGIVPAPPPVTVDTIGDICTPGHYLGTFSGGLRPELQLLEPHIARWQDRYVPRSGEENEELSRHPYLGAHFEFTSSPSVRRAGRRI